MILHQEYIELLKDIVRTPSFSREEDAVADLLENWMRGHGYEVHRCLNNLWTESEPESAKPTLLLNAHIDTVKPASGYTRDPFSAEICDNRIYGLGTNDDGGCIVALLETFELLSSRPQTYRLVYSATAEEEVCGMNGFDAVVPEWGKVDLGIIGEPTGMQMAVAEKGLLVLDCKAAGKSGHAAREEGINAIYEAFKDIEWFRNYRFDKVSPYLGPVKMSVTLINAGTQHNVVPDCCNYVVDVRPNGEYTNEEILETIKRNVRSEVTPRSLKHNSSSISEDNPVVIRGKEIGLSTYGSPTTSNQTRSPFTTLKIGPGQSSRSHSADEFICLDEISEAVEIYVKLLDNLQII